MSRHETPSRQPGITVVVGWDNPLGTFFAEVTRNLPPGDHSDPLLLWVGSSPGEVLRPEDLSDVLAPYATLDATSLAILRADRAAYLDRGPTPLQRAMLAKLAKRPRSRAHHTSTPRPKDRPVTSG